MSDESNADCSDPFYLLESEDVHNWMNKDGPFLYVTSPQKGDVAVPGDEYTVEVSSENHPRVASHVTADFSVYTENDLSARTFCENIDFNLRAVPTQ